jgi:hypothetical protein
MAMTVRSVAFPVPGALGVQESGFLVVGSALGIPGEMAFAISLIARVRDLAVGIPALLTWQIFEGRRFWRARFRERAERAPDREISARKASKRSLTLGVVHKIGPDIPPDPSETAWDNELFS